MSTLTIAVTPQQVIEKIIPLLPNKNQQSAFNQLNETEQKYVFWALESGQVNGNLPDIMTEGAAKVKQYIDEWKPKIDTIKKQQEQAFQAQEAERKNNEATLQKAMLKRQMNSFIKTVAMVVLKISSISANTKPKLVLEEILKHHQTLSEKHLHPILNAFGITDNDRQKRVRDLSWQIVYSNNLQKMPMIMVRNGSTLESAAAYAAAVKYLDAIFAGGNILEDDKFDKHLKDSMQKAENDNAKDDEENEGLTAQESLMFFRELLPVALQEIHKEISQKLSAM